MQQILEYKGWIVAMAFIFLFTLEHIRPAAKEGSHPVLRMIKNISFWPINIGLSLTFTLPLSYFATQHALWSRPDWSSGLDGLLFDIVLLDLFIFWWHRTVHEFPFFWRFHEVHHLDEHLDTTSAIRFHFGEILFATLARMLVIILFSIPFPSIILFEALVLVFTLFHHSNMALPAPLERLLSKIIITPSLHWVHHHALRKDTDSNYGTIFSFWDKLFHTKSDTVRFEFMKIGVEKKADKKFLKLLMLPFTIS